MKNFKQQGFSLLEILIAFTILALSIGVLLNVFSSGLRRAMLSEEYQKAVIIAQSNLATAGTEKELQEGRLQGSVDDKYFWSLEATLFVMGDESESEQIGITPYQVTSTVEWAAGKENRQVQLTSIKLASNSDEL